MLGYHPQVINAGRRINDGMGKFIAEQTVKHMIRNGWQVKGAPIIVLGLTFKEDCPDLRNSHVIDVMAAIVAAVAHREFKQRPLADYLGKLQRGGVLADVKSMFNAAELTAQGVTLWRL